MSILKQKTLKKEINLSGVGLHSGKYVNIKLIPQKPNTGIYFKRTDLISNNIIYPSVFNVSSALYCTKISNEYGVSVSTIEHLMAALYGKGVDNLLIEIDSEEVPILDEERGANAKITRIAIAAVLMYSWWSIETSIRRLGVHGFVIHSGVVREAIGTILANEIII